jgi:hypothetical protein
MKNALLLLLMGCVAVQGQISGGLDLAPKSPQSGKTQQPAVKEIAVTSLGATPEGAEKRAISDAIRQAVGAYVDAKTITENDAVIKDRILAVSSGFVKEYKVTAPAQKTDDGLYQISIIATVETNQVVAALKEAKIISGEIGGKNIWAESTSKLDNAEDARKMLEEKLPEIYKEMIKIQLVDEKGNVQQDTKPFSRVTDPKKKAVVLTWLVLISSDQTYYKDHVLPLFKKCIEAISGVSGKKFRAELKEGDRESGFDFSDFNSKWTVEEKNFIVETYPRSLKYVEGVYFEDMLQNFSIHLGELPFALNLECKSAIDEIISASKFSLSSSMDGEVAVQGGRVGRLSKASEAKDTVVFLPGGEVENVRKTRVSPVARSGVTRVVSPFFIDDTVIGQERGRVYLQPSVVRAVSIEIPIEEIKDVAKVNFNLEIQSECKVSLVQSLEQKKRINVPRW